MGHYRTLISGNDQDGYSVMNVNLGTSKVEEAYYFTSRAAATKKHAQLVRKNIAERHQEHRQMKHMLE